MDHRKRRYVLYSLTCLTLFSLLVFDFDFILDRDYFSLATEPLDSTCGYLVRSFWDGRLGSQMFVYASFYGMVQRQEISGNKTAFIRVSHLPSSLDQIFSNLSMPQKIVKNRWLQSKNFSELKENKCCAYDSIELDRLSCDGRNVLVLGYRNSYRYFDGVFEEIKQEFTFKKSIREKSRRLIDQNLAEKGLGKKHCITVGVHLRRGDFTKKHKMLFGHWPARVDYLKKAIRYHENLHSKNKSNISFCLAFLIFGEDYEWNLQAALQVELISKNSHLILIDSRKSTAEIDMCALATCDHAIISTGTFGWWVGFFSRGIVTYQKEYARFNSTIYFGFEPADYFLPHWIPL